MNHRNFFGMEKVVWELIGCVDNIERFQTMQGR